MKWIFLRWHWHGYLYDSTQAFWKGMIRPRFLLLNHSLTPRPLIDYEKVKVFLTTYLNLTHLAVSEMKCCLSEACQSEIQPVVLVLRVRAVWTHLRNSSVWGECRLISGRKKTFWSVCSVLSTILWFVRYGRRIWTMEGSYISTILVASENIADEGQQACYMYSSFQLCTCSFWHARSILMHKVCMVL